jgi:glutathione S-transferase
MELAAPVLASAAISLLAVLLYTYMGIAVGQMRGKHQIAAPAMVGHPELERAIRVHYNTLESLPAFLAALWIATLFFHSGSMPALGWLAPLLGVVWIVGRVIYMRGYMQAPDKRGTGFAISSLAVLVMILLGFIGIIMDWMAMSAA